MFKSYLICQQKIRIEMPSFLNDCEDWRIFEADFDSPDFSVKCNISNSLPQIEASPCGKLEDFSVYSHGNKVFRKRDMGIEEGVLSEYNREDGSECQLYFTPKSYPVLTDERFFWTSVPLAQFLLTRNAVLMHASFIDIGGSAVLFSAPSGTGKSTQAELWQLHRNAEVINGDKAGVYLKNGKAFAGGVPFCGTSRICKNRDLPLKAIVLLRQSKENRIKRLTGFEALQGVINNIYLDLLAPLEKQMCIDFVIELLGTVPIFSLECTADERAIQELEKVL